PAAGTPPAGTHPAYVAWRGARTQLYLRPLDRLESKAVPGTEGAQTPFFSPDGQWLGFCSAPGSIMKRVPVGGGTPLVVGNAANRGVGFARGASWSPDGTIVFAPDGTSPLYRVKADGGNPEALTTLDANRHETSHRMPECLPGGQGIVFTVRLDDTASFDDARIEALSLRTGERSVLVAGGTNARYAAGHLLYERAGSLWAAPFDPKALKLAGPAVLILEGVSHAPDYGSAHFAVSRDGSLVYVPGKARGVDRRLVRVTRAGKVSPLSDIRRGFEDLRLSPDGRKLALDVAGANNQIWSYDLERNTLRPQPCASTTWSRSGRRTEPGSPSARIARGNHWASSGSRRTAAAPRSGSRPRRGIG